MPTRSISILQSGRALQCLVLAGLSMLTLSLLDPAAATSVPPVRTPLAATPNPATVADCAKFRQDLSNEGIAESGYLDVPSDHYPPSATTPPANIKIFYWIRRGTDANKPPLLLIHGGPGGNSWRYYATFKTVQYAGDIVAIDNRNEGCSHVMAYDQDPSEYRIFRSRQVVEDLELLRKKLYPMGTKWRAFGQSRGVTIAHHYLEMYPESLESLQTHGFAAQSISGIRDYTFNRSRWNARASDRFELLFPDAAKVLREARSYFETNRTCLPMNLGKMNLPVADRPLACGGDIADAVSYKLSNYAKWSVISQDLLALRNPDGTLDTSKLAASFTKELDGNIYVGHMNYILGTNAQDVGSPSPESFPVLHADTGIMNALISEGRFVSRVVYPAYLSLGFAPVASSGDPVDFAKVRRYLESYSTVHGKLFPFVLFSSHFDTVAGPEMYDEEKREFQGLVEVRSLQSSGHEGWGTEKEVLEHLVR